MFVDGINGGRLRKMVLNIIGRHLVVIRVNAVHIVGRWKEMVVLELRGLADSEAGWTLPGMLDGIVDLDLQPSRGHFSR